MSSEPRVVLISLPVVESSSATAPDSVYGNSAQVSEQSTLRGDLSRAHSLRGLGLIGGALEG